MALRLAFDLDGVLADMEGELMRQAETLFGAGPSRTTETGPPRESEDTPGKPPDPSTPLLTHIDLTVRQQRKLWRHVETIPDFWESLREIEPGSVARLGALASRRRWEIIFLTKRPPSAGATSQLQTQRWLEARGFALPSVFVVQRSRGRIADALALDFVIDDRPENCLDVVADSRARAILVWRDGEQTLPAAARRLGIAVVKSVSECLDVLSQFDADAAPRATMIDRVMRMLGVKQPSGI